MLERVRQAKGDILRSVELFRAFRGEQSDPAAFYGLIARDAVTMVEKVRPVRSLRMLDVGGGPGHYTDAFRAAGARCVLVDLDAGEIARRAQGVPGVVGDAARLPVGDASVDLVFSSNMLEHVPDADAVRAELARVVRPGGLLVLSYTNWLSPWGGHETSPWHYLGGAYAAHRYARRSGGPPKNDYGRSLFALSVRDGLDWARSRDDLRLLEERPRYLPAWVRGLLRVPGLRELVTWNLWQVWEKRQGSTP